MTVHSSEPNRKGLGLELDGSTAGSGVGAGYAGPECQPEKLGFLSQGFWGAMGSL